MTRGEATFRQLIDAIASGDDAAAIGLLRVSPELATAAVEGDAVRTAVKEHFMAEIQRPLYAGDTALHIASAAYRSDLARVLIGKNADIRARNRRGAEPLHYAAVGGPGSRTWNPPAQAATIAYLIEAGADPDAVDKNGVTPLHRAVRTRCAAAVEALLAAGADAQRKNGNGSTPMVLAMHQTGRSGSGSPEAKAQQVQILKLLEGHGATP
jgi:hypothetical protein